MLNYTGYISDLNKLTDLLKQREAQRFDDRHVDFLLVQAGELACVSLNHLLVEAPFWDWIDGREEGDTAASAGFDDIALVANSKLLERLGYTGPPPAQEIVAEARQSIEKGKLRQESSKSVRDKIERLAKEVCSLAGWANGILSAYPRLPQNDIGKDKSSWLRIQEKFPVARMLRKIEKAVTILSGVVTILLGVDQFTPRPDAAPQDKPPISAPTPDIRQFGPDKPAQDFWFTYFRDGLDEPEYPPESHTTDA